jgi:hypothetical protein
MAKVHKYDMSRRLDNGKWEVVGKAYKDSESGRLTVWVDPAKMTKIVKGQKEDVPFILFDKDPEPPTLLPQNPVTQRTAKFVPKPSSPPPIETKASDSWPPDFDDHIPF